MLHQKDLHLTRVLHKGISGDDVIVCKRALSKAGVGYPVQKKHKGAWNPHFGENMDKHIKKLQKKHKLHQDGVIGYVTFKYLRPHIDAYGSKMLNNWIKQHMGSWGIFAKASAFAGIDMGVDFLGKEEIPMYADGEIVRVVHTGSGWPGIGGLIVVQCYKGPMAKHPIYSAEDVRIPKGNVVGKKLAMGDILAYATGTNQAPGIECGWSGSKANGYHGTLFQELHGHYSENPRATKEGADFWATLQHWMAHNKMGGN